MASDKYVIDSPLVPLLKRSIMYDEAKYPNVHKDSVDEIYDYKIYDQLATNKAQRTIQFAYESNAKWFENEALAKRIPELREKANIARANAADVAHLHKWDPVREALDRDVNRIDNALKQAEKALEYVSTSCSDFGYKKFSKPDTGETLFLTQGMLHSIGDRPALVSICGDKFWFEDGRLHRPNGLHAVELASGTKKWYTHGFLDRGDDLPAIEWSDGSKAWYRGGQRHRPRGPAFISPDGIQSCYIDDMLQSIDDKPSLQLPSGTKMWHDKNRLHRNTRAAIITADGIESYYKNDKKQGW